MGAVESHGWASAAAVLINGTPPHPVVFLAAGAPKVGSVFATSVVLVATTSSTHVAVSAGAGTPYTDPAIAGLVLLQGPLLFVDTATAPGVHLFPIPAHPALVGVELAMQGFRKDGSQMIALNGLALVLGI